MVGAVIEPATHGFSVQATTNENKAFQHADLQWLQNRAQFRLSRDQVVKLERLLSQMSREQFDEWLGAGGTLITSEP